MKSAKLNSSSSCNFVFSLLLPTYEVLIKQLEDLPLIPSRRQHCLLAARAPPNCCFGVGCVWGLGRGRQKAMGLIFQLSVHFSWVRRTVFEFYDGSKWNGWKHLQPQPVLLCCLGLGVCFHVSFILYTMLSCVHSSSLRRKQILSPFSPSPGNSRFTFYFGEES